jgi:hypothetical protein
MSTNAWMQWFIPVTPATWGSTNKRIMEQANPGIKLDPISKITSAKKA